MDDIQPVILLPLGMTKERTKLFQKTKSYFILNIKESEKLLEKVGKGQNIRHDSDGKITEDARL